MRLVNVTWQDAAEYCNWLSLQDGLPPAYQSQGGKLALAGATLNRDSEVAAAGLRGAAGKSEYLAALRGADITRLTGAAAKSNANYQAAATIFSGVGDAAKTYYQSR